MSGQRNIGTDRERDQRIPIHPSFMKANSVTYYKVKMM